MGASSGGSNPISAQFSNKIYKPQGKAFEKLWAQLPGLYDQLQGGTNQMVPWAQDYMMGNIGNTNAGWQNQLAGGAYQGLDLNNQLNQSLENTLNSPTNTQQIYGDIMGGQGNNYADAMRNQYTIDANRTMDNMLANLDARAAGNGMSGSSRQGIAQGLGIRDINQNLQSNLAQLGYNTFDKDLANKLSIAGQADQATLQRQQMLSDLIGQKNATQAGAVGQGGQMQDVGMGAFAPGQMPWQNIQAWQNSLMPIINQQTGTLSGGGGSSGSWKI
jgi:hypothetical protein